MIWLKEDIHCDLFVKTDILDDLISIGYSLRFVIMLDSLNDLT
jgi:hypothetical protein